MDTASSPLEKISFWIYENKNLFNSAQYIEIMRLVADAYKNNNNELLTFDYRRFRLHINDDDEIENEWSGNDEIDGSSGSDSSDNETTYTGNYINHY